MRWKARVRGRDRDPGRLTRRDPSSYDARTTAVPDALTMSTEPSNPKVSKSRSIPTAAPNPHGPHGPALLLLSVSPPRPQHEDATHLMLAAAGGDRAARPLSEVSDVA